MPSTMGSSVNVTAAKARVSASASMAVSFVKRARETAFCARLTAWD